MTVADRIRFRREALGMTQDELAKKMGYDGKSSISKMENSGNNVTLKKIAKVAPFLCTSKEYLMGWVNNPDPDYPNTKIGKIEELSSQVSAENLQREEKEKQIAEAMDIYQKYQSAPPEIQSAIETLLKASQSES